MKHLQNRFPPVVINLVNANITPNVFAELNCAFVDERLNDGPSTDSDKYPLAVRVAAVHGESKCGFFFGGQRTESHPNIAATESTGDIAGATRCPREQGLRHEKDSAREKEKPQCCCQEFIRNSIIEPPWNSPHYVFGCYPVASPEPLLGPRPTVSLDFIG